MAGNIYATTSSAYLVVGDYLYTDSALTTPAPSGCYSDGINNFSVGGSASPVGYINQITACSGNVENLVFNLTTSSFITVTAIDVNGNVPTLVSGYDVPFSTDTHGYSTDQLGLNQNLNITVTITTSGCSITVIDSDGNSYCQTLSASGLVTFSNIVINDVTTVQVITSDGACV